jgi:hypothetical protein
MSHDCRKTFGFSPLGRLVPNRKDVGFVGNGFADFQLRAFETTIQDGFIRFIPTRHVKFEDGLFSRNNKV